MSYAARLALFALLAACSSPKPPAAEEPALPSPDPAPEPAPGASSDAPVLETLFVRETLADCQAEGTRQCLQVRSSEQEDWRNFFSSIEGFQHEASYAYELRVEVTPVPNAPADAPALHYRLVDVVAKRKAIK